ncbi:MAG: hypothetical protein JNN08_30765 [Bryobacterales bacterium]|nr:hypothetical protein [Bryobacterales bacterium]
MEHRSQKATIRILILVVAGALSTVLWGQQLQFDVRHERALKDHPGRVTIDERGVEYQQVLTAKQQAKAAKGKKIPNLESVRWDYPDIQELWVSPHKLVLVTYKDRKWFLGVDKEFEFFLTGKGQTYDTAYELLRGKLDQRFVAALADPNVEAAWEMPVKLLGALQGSEGVLQVGADRIVYKTARRDQSRTWRLGDIENVSTSGPFQLTLTTYERAKMHYGSRKGFNFQLKTKLDQQRFDLLWKRLNRDKGLQFLTSIEERNQQ